MGEQVLRCIGCLGKFGTPVSDNRCLVCGGLYRFSSFLLSDHFPSCGGAILEQDIRNLYFKALEGADSFRRSHQGGPPPPRPVGVVPTGATQLGGPPPPGRVEASPAVGLDSGEPPAPVAAV